MNLLRQIIPTPQGDLIVDLDDGQTIYIVGPNGSGKSALIAHLAEKLIAGKFRRITANRQNWMSADASGYTPAQRIQQRENLAAYSNRSDTRYLEHSGDAPLNLLISALSLAKEEWSERFIAKNRSSGIKVDVYENENPAPLSVLNDVLKLGALPISVSFDSDTRLIASREGGASIGVSKLSDGERNAIILAGEVITAPKNHIIIIDEPERHLHRSIVEPLLNALFAKRPDCGFIIATHEISLPASTEKARAFILRGCEWDGDRVKVFDVNELSENASLPQDLRYAILGSRPKILFVEGDEGSFDRRVYNIMFPKVSVIPKGGCRNVIEAVKGVRGAASAVWVEAFGLIDRDNRTSGNISKLQQAHVYALKMTSVESLLYGQVARNAVAADQALKHGIRATDLVSASLAAALDALKATGTAVDRAAQRCEAVARERAMSQLPKAAEIAAGSAPTIAVDVVGMLAAEVGLFNKMLAENDLDALIARYQLRSTGCFAKIAEKLMFKNSDEYVDAVIVKLEHDDAFLVALRRELGPLATILLANPPSGDGGPSAASIS